MRERGGYRRVLALLVLVTGWVGVAPSAAAGQTVGVIRVLGGNGFGDAYRVGFGASAGLEFPFIRDRFFFLGVRGVHHLGSDGTLSGLGGEGGSDPVGTISQTQAGIEIGTTWMSEPLLIRTVGGVGVARVSVSIDSGTSALEGVNRKLTYGPGLLIARPTDGGRFFGVELRWVKVSDFDSALSLFGTIGIRIL